MNDDPQAFPLFKGATRVPTKFGIPTTPLLIAFGAVALVAMWASLWWWFMLLPVVVIMRLITKHDDRAFGIWWLWLETKGRNKNKKFWGASSYAPTDYRKRFKR